VNCNFIWPAAAGPVYRTHGSFWTSFEGSTVKKQKSCAVSQSRSPMRRGTRILSKRNQRDRFQRIEEKLGRSLLSIAIIPKRVPWPGKSLTPALARVRYQRTTRRPQSQPQKTKPAQARIPTQRPNLTSPNLAISKSRQHPLPRKKICLIRLT
jgi:hypothetical protein